MSSYTFTTHVGDGTTKIFPFSFAGQDEGYLRTTDITVYVDGISSPFTINPSDLNRVIMATAPAVGAEVLIRRIMPKDVPYSDFSRGNPFSQDTLNNTNLQMLYNIQEIFDGYLPDGFYFRQDVNMFGHKFYNLGPGVVSGDSVNYDQWYQHDVEIKGIADAILVDDLSIRTVAFSFIAIAGQTVWTPGIPFTNAYVYLNGLFQHKLEGAFTVTNNSIVFAEPLDENYHVYGLLGTGPTLPDEYRTEDELKALYFDAMQAQLDGLSSDADLLTVRVGTLETRTQPLNLGGTGATTLAGAQLNLNIFPRTGVVDGTPAQAGDVGQRLTNTTSATAITSGVPKNSTSLLLTPGEWEVSGSFRINTTTAQVYLQVYGISDTSETSPGFPYIEQLQFADGTVSQGTQIRQMPRRIIRVSANTTIYGVVSASFPSGTATVDGYLEARRVR